MSATSGGGGSVSEGSEAGGSSQSTMSVSDSPSTSFQANLAAENVTKITLTEENSAGGYAVDVTGSKINLTLDERQQKDGIVNVAFDYEEAANRGGGEFRSMNGSEKKDKVPEAVNLELVNMVPYSNGNGTSYGVPVNGIPGIPMKKDSEQVDMSTPYDEYFVPVNEHKKYMRGEKLYVTKDKRRPTSWRRCLSWIVACTVISVVLIVAILAGTGVILSQEPDLVKDASVGRNFAGSNLKPSVTDKSLMPTTEKLMYVPRSIESEFVIDNLDFDPAFRDLNSSAYQQFATSMESQLKMLLFDKETLEFGASDIGVRVVNVSRDPFKVNYRIGWNYKQGVNNPPEPIKMEDVKKRLVESLARNQGYIDKYHIDREAIKVNHVINACQIENGGCSHICYYNYITQKFTCTCPTHLVLDSTGKNCVAWSGPSEDDAVPVPSHAAYPGTPSESTANTAQEYEHKSSFQHEVHGVHHHHETGSDHSTDSEYKGHTDQTHGDHEPSAEPIPEPTAEPGPGEQDKSSVDLEGIPEPTPEPNAKETQSEEQGRGMHTVSITGGDDHYGHGEHNVHSSHETSGSEVVPEPTAEPTSEGKDHDYGVHSVHGSEEPAPEPAPEPGSEEASKDHSYTVHSSYGSKDHEPSAEPTPEPAPEPTAEPSSEGKDHSHASEESKDHGSVAEPIPGSDDHVHSVHETEDREPVAEPTAEPSSEGKDHAGHSLYGSHEPAAEPTPEPAPEPNAEGKDHAVFSHESKDHEPTAEPSPEGKDHIVQSSYDSKDREPTAEPTAEPSAEGKDHILHSSYDSGEHEPSAEPTAEPSAEGKDHVIHSSDDSKDHEPAAEPTAEPTAKVDDHVVHSSYDSGHHEPAAEPTPEPTPEPAAEPNAEDKSHATHTLYGSKDHEHAAGTTTEPNRQGQDNEHGAHSVSESKEVEEPIAEPSTGGSDKDHDAHFVHTSKGNEPVAEPTAEPTAKPSSESQDKEQSVHSPHESGDSEATKTQSYDSKHYTVHGFTGGDRTAELTPEPTAEPTPEPSGDSDHQTRSSNVGGRGHIVATSHSEGHVISEPESSLKNSNQEQVQVTEYRTEHPSGTHSDRESESQEEIKSGHRVPYLQDVLIRGPGFDFEKKNATSEGQNTVQNVVRANGDPVIEEILVERSQPKGQEETNTSPAGTTGFRTYTDNESDRSKPVTAEGSSDLKGFVTGSANEKPSDESFVVRQSNGTSASNGVTIPLTEGVTNGPTNVEQSTTVQPVLEGKEMSTVGGVGNSENPKDTHESASTRNNQETTDHFNAGVSHFGLSGTPYTKNETDSEGKPTPEGTAPGTTMQPERRNEFHTNPVAVEFSSSAQSNANTNETPKQENQTEIPEQNAKPEELQTTGKTNLGRTEGSGEAGNTPNGDTILSNGGLAQTKVHETTTESHIPMTTLLSLLSPSTAGQTISEKEKEANLRESTVENKTSNQPEVNETTKSPEELSNNIKDELLDNEEFNTLLDKEYGNREGGSTNDKEVISKYPNKSQKADKKKIKDYTKGEKGDVEKKAEVTARPAVTPEDFILQKHVNGNEHTFDLEYSLQNEHTTKHDGEVTVVDPHGLEGVPGVSFKPHGINNHDLRVLQTVAPDFRTETAQTYELDAQKSDSKVKVLDNKEGEPKQDKEYAKFDKDYKYEKQKVSKKKDLKKKGGSGKDGKNVELDDGRKLFTEVSREDYETSHETVKDVPETTMNPSFEKITVQPETGVRLVSGSAGETTTIPDYRVKVETTQSGQEHGLENRTVVTESTVEHLGQSESVNEKTGPQVFGESTVQFQDNDQKTTHVDKNNHQIIDEPSVKTTSNTSPGTVYDGQLLDSINVTDSTRHSPGGYANTESRGVYKVASSVTPGTVFDGMPDNTTPHGLATDTGFEASGSLSGAGGHSTFMDTKIVTNEGAISEHGGANTTTANPTIIIHGQSGNLQDGHNMRFANSTLNPGNVSVVSVLNGTLNPAVGHTFTFTNFTRTFPNGSVVHPTIIVRGQSGTLQDGHEIRFGNATFVTTLPNGQQTLKNSTVYRIENGSLPDTVFDGHFSPQNGHYHMFSNASGTFVYSNISTQPTFIIKGESGDFGNSRAYIMANGSGSPSHLYGGLTSPSVIFRNSTVFAVGSSPEGNVPTVGVHGITAQPQDVTSNETIHYTRQVSPNFFSTGTAYKVNNYFGYISKCAAGQFQCVNGTSKRGSACISLSSKCDSINDCSDGSDELGCIENGCPGNFQCSDGSCLKRNLVCNGILDCSDGSDEKQCESWKCEFDEFQCPSGRCIPVVWQCDGKPDCDNHTDEYNCQTSCGNDEYLCPEGWCVPLTYKCNGVKECSNGEDEQLCDCSHEEFKCQTGGCVSLKQVCDGLDDCPDRSDEWDCVKLEPGSNLLKIRTPSGDYEPVCADNWISQYSDEVCASLGYYSSVPIENENSSSPTTDTSFFALKNVSTDNFNKKVIVNLRKSEGNCSSGKLVEIACQEFSCGSRSMTDSSSVEARLVGGMSATAGQWPSVALLYNIRNFYSCTANILTPRWVLASYNCLKMGNKNLNEQDWKFFGGSTVFEAERENAETRKILSIIPHPQVKFNQFLFSNDLALVELDKSLQFTSNLGAVCLPEQEMQPRQICIAAGWGMNAPEDKSIRQQLQYLPVPTMNLTECNSTEHYSGFITDDKICAGYNSGQKSLCYNEEGAPLMCVNDRLEWELQGVLSYHSNCGRGSHPSIFSSITPVVDWIKKTIGNAFERKTAAVTKR